MFIWIYKEMKEWWSIKVSAFKIWNESNNKQNYILVEMWYKPNIQMREVIHSLWSCVQTLY